MILFIQSSISIKHRGKLDLSLGKVPFLVVRDEQDTTNTVVEKVICQSKAIERYLARRFNLMGKTDIEYAVIDSICECIRDFKISYQRVKKTKDKEAISTWFSKILPNYLQKLEKIISANSSTTINCVGSSLSLADIVLYSFMVDYFDNKEGVTTAMTSCPIIRSIIEEVAEDSNIAYWVSTRPQTTF